MKKGRNPRRALLVLLTALVLGGCGGEAGETVSLTPEESVRLSAARALEDIRRLGQTAQAPVALACLQTEQTAAVPAAQTAQAEDWQALLRSVLEDFTYRIEDVEVEEDSAQVTVTLFCKPAGEALLAWMDRLQGDREGLRALAALSEEEQERQLQAQLLAALDAAGTKPSAAVLPFTQESGAWTLTAQGQASLLAALRGE